MNEEGLVVLGAIDLDPAWRRRRRPVGRYVATAWIPGNFLAEGAHLVEVTIATIEPTMVEVHEQSLIAFQVIDSLDGDSARGDWAGYFAGTVRPMLEWSTEYEPMESGCAVVP